MKTKIKLKQLERCIISLQMRILKIEERMRSMQEEIDGAERVQGKEPGVFYDMAKREVVGDESDAVASTMELYAIMMPSRPGTAFVWADSHSDALEAWQSQTCLPTSTSDVPTRAIVYKLPQFAGTDPMRRLLRPDQLEPYIWNGERLLKVVR